MEGREKTVKESNSSERERGTRKYFSNTFFLWQIEP